MGLLRTIDADIEPVTLAEAKAFCRVTHDDEDAILSSLVKTARMQAENQLNRALITQTWQLTLDAFPDAIQLPYAPVASISAVRYVDEDGVTATLSPACYTLDNKAEPAWLVPADGFAWPDTDDRINVVTVTYTAGYGSAASFVPEPIKTWILLQVGHFYRNREAAGEAVQPMPFIESLLDPYRVPMLP